RGRSFSRTMRTDRPAWQHPDGSRYEKPHHIWQGICGSSRPLLHSCSGARRLAQVARGLARPSDEHSATTWLEFVSHPDKVALLRRLYPRQGRFRLGLNHNLPHKDGCHQSGVCTPPGNFGSTLRLLYTYRRKSLQPPFLKRGPVNRMSYLATTIATASLRG